MNNCKLKFEHENRIIMFEFLNRKLEAARTLFKEYVNFLLIGQCRQIQYISLRNAFSKQFMQI